MRINPMCQDQKVKELMETEQLYTKWKKKMGQDRKNKYIKFFIEFKENER